MGATMSRLNGLPGYDHWLTTEPDDGHSLEKCETCDGEGVRYVVYDWHGYPQDGEAECEDCDGQGWIEVDASGLPCPAKKAKEPSR